MRHGVSLIKLLYLQGLTDKMNQLKCTSIADLVEYVSYISEKKEGQLVFRGEKKNYGATALHPLVYRGYIDSEDKIYRESQRFNDHEFDSDKGVFDRLSRIQHYSAPTRLIDVSEDLLSAVYFAIADKDITVANAKDAIIYIFEIDEEQVKYYDSDAVSAVSNLAKIPCSNNKLLQKTKKQLLCDAIVYREDIDAFNAQDSVNFLLHEVKDEKPHFANIINPKDLLTVHFVWPKLTSNRLRSQKGAFILFGLNEKGWEKPIELLNNGVFDNSLKKEVGFPIIDIHIVVIDINSIERMKIELENLGIRKSFMFPEIDKVSEYLKDIYNKT